MLGQTFGDFELILSDNASTDATDRLCRLYAARDPRVRYLRNERNVGAYRNFNATAAAASGVYFKWLAHDDMLAPEYLDRCVAALDACPHLAGCHTNIRVLDANGGWLRDYVYRTGYASSPDRVGRFVDLLHEDRFCLEMFAVFRLSVLRRTNLLAPYVGSDRVLRAHVGLLGPLQIVPEFLCFNRDHPARSLRAFPAHHLRLAWWDPTQAGRRIFPHWRILTEYLRLVRRSALSRHEQGRCITALVLWCGRDLNWARLGADVMIALAPGSWRIVASLTGR